MYNVILFVYYFRTGVKKKIFCKIKVKKIIVSNEKDGLQARPEINLKKCLKSNNESTQNNERILVVGVAIRRREKYLLP
jgi:lipopolysaccharide/colanic/teichoic acid biosynthesis glycosyltransferase